MTREKYMPEKKRGSLAETTVNHITITRDGLKNS